MSQENNESQLRIGYYVSLICFLVIVICIILYLVVFFLLGDVQLDEFIGDKSDFYTALRRLGLQVLGSFIASTTGFLFAWYFIAYPRLRQEINGENKSQDIHEDNDKTEKMISLGDLSRFDHDEEFIQSFTNELKSNETSIHVALITSKTCDHYSTESIKKMWLADDGKVIINGNRRRLFILADRLDATDPNSEKLAEIIRFFESHSECRFVRMSTMKSNQNYKFLAKDIGVFYQSSIYNTVKIQSGFLTYSRNNSDWRYSHDSGVKYAIHNKVYSRELINTFDKVWGDARIKSHSSNIRNIFIT